MNGKSLGEDIYSPIRFDGSRSHNDSMMSNADGSISEFFSGAYNTGYKKDSKKSLEPIKDEDFDEKQNEDRVEIFEKSNKKNNRRNSDLFSRRNTHLLFLDSKDHKSTYDSDVFSGPSPVDSVSLPDSSPNRSPRMKETKNVKIQNKESITKRSSKTKCVPDNKFITVRRESRTSRSNLSPGIETTRSSDRPQSSTDKKLSPEMLSTKSSDRSQSSTGKKLSPEVLSTKSSDCPLSSTGKILSPEMLSTKSSDCSQSSKSYGISSELLEASSGSNVDCSSQTDLTLSDLQILMNKVDVKSTSGAKSTVKMPTVPYMVDPVTHSAGFEGNSLEKLKDTMENEFHDIRQILYLQQLAMSKILYKNLDETESTNSGLKMVAKSLNSIIDLLKNNQQLRNTDFSQHFHS